MNPRRPTRDLTAAEFKILSSPAVLEAITQRVLHLEATLGLDRDTATVRALDEAEEELIRQSAAKAAATSQRVEPQKPKAFGATFGEMLAKKGRK